MRANDLKRLAPAKASGGRGVADPMIHTIGEAQALGEDLPRSHVGLGEVEDRDAAAMASGERAGRSPEAAADIEHAGSRGRGYETR